MTVLLLFGAVYGLLVAWVNPVGMPHALGILCFGFCLAAAAVLLRGE